MMETKDVETQVPVTIVTGFLGSGKTTLLNYILTEQHGKRIAVVENEFADDIGIESLILKNGVGGDVADGFYELQNGCLCCTVKDSLVETLEKMMTMKERFDYVLIETSGMANPGPVAATFWSDLGDITAKMQLDGIITVADAWHIERHLADYRADGSINEAAQQIACADVVLLNKVDQLQGAENCDVGSAMVSGTGIESLDRIFKKIRNMNSTTTVIPTVRCRVDLDQILNVRAFDPQRLLNLDAFHDGDGTGSDPIVLTKEHSHDSTITTVVLRAKRPIVYDNFRTWIAEILWQELDAEATQVPSARQPVPALLDSDDEQMPDFLVESLEASQENAADDGLEKKESPKLASTPLILRGKGVLCVASMDGVEPLGAKDNLLQTEVPKVFYLKSKYLFQSVVEQFDLLAITGAQAEWSEDDLLSVPKCAESCSHDHSTHKVGETVQLDYPVSKLVLIGRHLNVRKLQEEFESCCC